MSLVLSWRVAARERITPQLTGTAFVLKDWVFGGGRIGCCLLAESQTLSREGDVQWSKKTLSWKVSTRVFRVFWSFLGSRKSWMGKMGEARGKLWVKKGWRAPSGKRRAKPIRLSIAEYPQVSTHNHLAEPPRNFCRSCSASAPLLASFRMVTTSNMARLPSLPLCLASR